jgi:hypothetical protein
MYTPNQEQLDRWLAGEEVDVVQEESVKVPWCNPGRLAVAPSSTPGNSEGHTSTGLSQAGLEPFTKVNMQLSVADGVGAAEGVSESDGVWEMQRVRAKQRALSGVYPLALSGDRSLNIDGELTGFTPCRVRAVHAVLPVFVNPDPPSAHRM